MKTHAIKRIADRISRKYCIPPPIVSNIDGKCGDKRVEIRSELTLLEGGHELCDKVGKLNEYYICEPQGGCAYVVYKLQ